MLETIQRRLKRGSEIRRSEIYTWFHGLPPEILLYLAAKAVRDEVRRFVSLYLTHLRLVRPSLDGNDLQALGLTAGPRFRGIMEHLLAARLDGEISSEDEERALATRLILSKNHT
jgi:tRNA nucleotidyltransferase (CCA-adding enzyme)